MWIRVLFSLWLTLGAGVSVARADGYVETTGSYSEGEPIRGNRYDTGGNLKATLPLLGGEHVAVAEADGYMRTTGAVVRQTTVTSAVTTNTTSTAVALPIGAKTFYGQVVGTGAVTQTQEIYCDIDGDAANGVLAATLTLSGTTRDQAKATVTEACSYFYVVTTATTGTSATGAVYAMY